MLRFREILHGDRYEGVSWAGKHPPGTNVPFPALSSLDRHLCHVKVPGKRPPLKSRAAAPCATSPTTSLFSELNWTTGQAPPRVQTRDVSATKQALGLSDQLSLRPVGYNTLLLCIRLDHVYFGDLFVFEFCWIEFGMACYCQYHFNWLPRTTSSKSKLPIGLLIRRVGRHTLLSEW